MKIIRLEATNVKRLSAVEIEPDGNVVVISGANAQGKSSVLDAIWMALGGGQAQKGTSRPIRDGETEAEVILDLGDIIVTKTWEEGKTPSLKVMSPVGAKFNSPQKMLDELLGAMTFDPLAFTQQSAKDQLATLLSLVELPFDPIELDGRKQAIYDDRREVGRTVTMLEGKLQGALIPVEEPGFEQSAAEAVDRYVAAQSTHSRYDALWADRRASEAEVERLQKTLNDAKARMAAADEAMAAMGHEMPDLDALKEAVDTVEERNIAIRRHREMWDLAQQHSALLKEQGQRTSQIAAIDQERADALAAAKMPIEGLSFDEEGVIYNGVPFSQASSAEQLKVSVAMAIATNPTIRVGRIMDGSLLDKASFQIISEMAEEHDFQLWIEVVDESGELGVYIEDGMVKA